MIYEVMKQLKDKGYRITPQRRVIIEKIVHTAGLLTAAEIWNLVRQEYNDIGLDTIYRNISMLTEMGILIPISGTGKESTRYELAHANHHHHVVCVKCGQAVCIDYCPINQEFIEMLRMNGYELIRHNVELLGLCTDCKSL
ncbi:Fur family transcriptional regulator [Pelosinus sp. UFO1]|uniref:Fur family transcriptional regulator n=1 Tax=Pelosinus sp. UFO1 TaxID=484770 RepID=UPI0004D12C3B|nr:Fur family transcriptional regulator [Pelosinus sp. UFO1]AIF52207.1 ferric uptake regulator, Fur family [Pelosinus sp. UFO1]